MLNITAIDLITIISKQISEIEDKDIHTEACRDFTHWAFVLSNYHASSVQWKNAIKKLKDLSKDLTNP